VTPVAVTRYCEQPTLPAVGGTKNPDLDAIIDLAPDLVVVDDEENRREDADALVRAGLAVHVTHVRTLDDVGPVLVELARAVGASFDHATFIASIAAARVDDGRPPRRAFIPIWRRPWMSMNGDTYGSALLAACGVDNVLAGVESRYPEVTLADVASRRPELVLLPSEPYPFGERHGAELAVALDAAVVLVDGQDLFWWGARTPDALARLRTRLSP
jgi:ABC-type Fe3+-hydroxamate transport system substrate-binding protein